MEALCGETDTFYIELEPSRFDKTYVGEGNEELEKIWAEAEAHDKTIIFIDEISGLANRADKNASQTASNIINNLLTKLDGFKISDKKIILMGATNHLEKIDSALRSRFQKEIKIDSFKKEEIPGFLKFLSLAKNYRLSYHTINYLKEIVGRVPQNKKLSNRDWTKIMDDAFLTYDRLSQDNLNHEVMLPSDLDEALEEQLGIQKPQKEIIARRQACEKQYQAWKEGLLPYLKHKDQTIIEQKYVFNRFNGLDKCQYQEDVKRTFEDKDWYFLKNSFDEWPQHGKTYLDLFRNMHIFKDVKSESIFDMHLDIARDKENYKIILTYKGPKYLLEGDKDYYIAEVSLSSEKQSGYDVLLHFNPVKQYLTLYYKKMNIKEKK